MKLLVYLFLFISYEVVNAGPQAAIPAVKQQINIDEHTKVSPVRNDIITRADDCKNATIIRIDEPSEEETAGNKIVIYPGNLDESEKVKLSAYVKNFFGKEVTYK